MMWKKICWILCAATLSINTFADNTVYEDDGTGQTDKVAVNQQSQDAIGNMLLQSISLIGIPYRWGGNTPQSGMDCSGFIRYVFKKSLGINLPRTASEMSRVGKRVSVDALEPGDLIFFNTKRGSNTHVGMYIGDNKFIQSPRTGDTIQVTELTSSWRSKINGAKRIVQEDEADDGSTTVESFQEINDEALPVRSGYSRRTVASNNSRHKSRVKHSSSHSTKSHSTSNASHHSRKKKHG